MFRYRNLTKSNTSLLSQGALFLHPDFLIALFGWLATSLYCEFIQRLGRHGRATSVKEHLFLVAKKS